MGMSELLKLVRRHHIVVALRGIAGEEMVSTARALWEGGVRMLEVTFDQRDPDCVKKTPAAIRAIREELGDELLVGAGTVLTREQASAAVEAGAGYLLAPSYDPQVLERAKELGVELIPGVFTPSEAAAAWLAGAALVKLFPGGSLGLPYIKNLAGPLGQIPLLPMGGVGLDNLTDFLSQPNVAGVGIGSAIAKPALVQAGDFAGLRELARSFTEKAAAFGGGN